MDYGMIGKIEKSKFYAQEPERFSFDSFTVRLEGDSGGVHNIKYDVGHWDCDCSFFHSRGYCSHTMAIERVLGEMLGQPSVA
ncbi:MAG: SWIM zinc finger family protein [Anaerolineaceae bacterium]|nr:SWIM zinc finger family protein [Anaerolineaceae bacterium]